MNLAETFIQSDLHCFQDNDHGIDAVLYSLSYRNYILFIHLFIYWFIANVYNLSEQPMVTAIVM